MYFLVDLGDDKFVVCEKHGMYSEQFRAITFPISGATWAAEVLSDIQKNENISCKLSSLTRYHMRPYKR